MRRWRLLKAPKCRPNWKRKRRRLKTKNESSLDRFFHFNPSSHTLFQTHHRRPEELRSFLSTRGRCLWRSFYPSSPPIHSDRPESPAHSFGLGYFKRRLSFGRSGGLFRWFLRGQRPARPPAHHENGGFGYLRHGRYRADTDL